MRRWQVDHFHDHGQLFGFVLTRKYRIAGKQLDKYAAERPHVNGGRVRNAQNDLGRSIKSALNVRVNYEGRKRRRQLVN